MNFPCFKPALLCLALPALAQSVPTTINYQGRLTDNSPAQTPVNATTNMQFEIWDVPSGGVTGVNRLWREPNFDNAAVLVSVNNGVFSYALGSTNPVPPALFTGATSARFLQIIINPGASQELLTPRQAITATGYAGLAEAANSAVNSAGLGGTAASGWQKALGTASCPANQFYNAIAAGGSAGCAAPSAAAETDPRVGTLSNGRIPRWSSTSLVDGTLFDNGSLIGLNTASPNVDLHIGGPVAVNKRIQFTHAGTGTTLLDGALLGISGSPADAFFLQNEAQPLWFGTSGNERMRIDASGRVGINNVSPFFTLQATDVTGSGVSIVGESANASFASIYVNSLNAAASAGYGYERSGTLMAYTGVNTANDFFLNVGSGNNVLYGRSSNGAVGINNAAPTEKLHILGASGADVKAKVEGVGNSGSAGFQAKGSSSATDVMEMTQYNVAAAGSVAGVPLANLGLLYTGAGAGRMLLDVITANPMQFATGNAVRMTIDPAGNVGIGNPNPTRMFEVAGTAAIGVNGTTLSNIIRAAVIADVPSVANNVSTTFTFAVPNAAPGATAMVSPANAYGGLEISYARVSAAGTVEIGLVNHSGAAIDPPSMNYFITVIQ